MDQQDIQTKVEAFLKDLGVPGFIVFGYMKSQQEADPENKEFQIVSSFHEMPTNAAIKGLSKVLSEFTERTL